MTQQLIERLQTVQIGDPCEAGGLQVFALRWPSAARLTYTTLDDGLAGGLLEISELSEGGSVPTLKVVNKGDVMAFLMAGEQLAGGKQNRVLNASIMIPARSELPLPVSCVERGRWAYRSPRFGSTGSSSHSKLRHLMHAHATSSYRSEGKPTSRQSEVWQEVDRKLSEVGSHSPSDYLNKAYEDSETTLQEILAKLPVPEDANGAVFAFGGRIVGFDLFDQPATLAKLWPKLIRAYAIDACFATAPPAATVSRAGVESWLRGAESVKEEVFKSPGLGDDVRLESPQLVGAGLLVEDSPIHVEVFHNG
jgi:hypothetical protein